MLEFDEELALRKYMRESGDTEILAEPTIQNLKTVDERLHPHVMSWLDGWELMDFNFHGLTLSYIMAKENCGYISAIFTMTCILESGDPIDDAKYYMEKRIVRK